MSNPTIGFIGYGNMAQAIAEGLVAAGAVDGADIVACAAHYDKLEKTTMKVGAKPLHNAAEVVAASDMVVIAIIGAIADEDKFVVSIAAGWDLDKYRDLFGADFNAAHIQCTIPNTPMAVGKGVLVTETDNTLTAGQTEVFERLFSSISLIERVDSAHMGIGMCIAGCAPAFTDMYIEALGDAGVKYGLQRATAYRLAAKMVEGVGALYLKNETHPGVMKDAVCSPGGTTIKGVASLEESAFRGAVIKAVDAIEA